ncbi:MAG: TRAP transporter small permease [Thiogranum sp.]|nr:TRAP transporter small permease [Thiogranum sp.]
MSQDGQEPDAPTMPMLNALRDILLRIETWFAAGSLLLLLALALLQIVARNLFDSGIASADTLTRYLVLYVTFFGAAIAVERNRHIRIDAATTLLSPRALRRLYRPLRAIATGICALLAYAAIRFWRDEWQYVADHERWQVYIGLVIPAGFVLLTIQFLLGTIAGPDDE